MLILINITPAPYQYAAHCLIMKFKYIYILHIYVTYYMYIQYYNDFPPSNQYIYFSHLITQNMENEVLSVRTNNQTRYQWTVTIIAGTWHIHSDNHIQKIHSPRQCLQKLG